MATNEERLATLEANDRTIFKQLDDVKSDVKAINKLATSVERMAVSMQSMDGKIDSIDNRLETVEKEPIDTLKYIKRQIVSTIIGTILGAVLGGIIALVVK